MKAARAKPATSRNADTYLHRLGERVRVLRNQRGMTRKALAQHAHVSERYLAQLEAGLGNCSIVLLRRIARAIGLPITQLIHDGAEPSLDMVLLTQFLERLPPDLLVDARKLVTEHFNLASEQHRHRIALIGLRGGGKSTLGRLLADKLSTQQAFVSSGQIAKVWPRFRDGKVVWVEVAARCALSTRAEDFYHHAGKVLAESNIGLRFVLLS